MKQELIFDPIFQYLDAAQLGNTFIFYNGREGTHEAMRHSPGTPSEKNDEKMSCCSEECEPGGDTCEGPQTLGIGTKPAATKLTCDCIDGQSSALHWCCSFLPLASPVFSFFP